MNTLYKIVSMYNEIKELFAEGKTKSAIARELECDRKTVRKYLRMDVNLLEAAIERMKHRIRKLNCYEDFVRQRIELCPECSAAQVEDWLKEHFENFPAISSRTVFSFVQYVRKKYHLFKPAVSIRQCEAVEELPYGEQAQVDFGVSWMRDHYGNRVKVFFMVMVLSRSRQKFVIFTNQTITSGFLIYAMEKAFAYFKGLPVTIVFDQDTTVLKDENYGDLIYSHEFMLYQAQRKFRVFMCRKADPQTKGKVESSVKYVKNNFLRGRLFSDIETLNQSGLAWLERTANTKIHGTTHLVPHMEWLTELEYLQPFVPIPVEEVPGITYGVRKDNTVLYKGNRYTVPTGTYQGPDTKVFLKIDQEFIHISDLNENQLACFAMEQGKGKLIINNDHRRDKTAKIDTLEKELILCFSNQELAASFTDRIRKRFPRYARDQFSQIRKTIQKQDQGLVDLTLAKCLDLQLFSSGEFKDVFEYLTRSSKKELVHTLADFKPMMPGDQLDQILLIKPQQSHVMDYQRLMK